MSNNTKTITLDNATGTDLDRIARLNGWPTRDEDKSGSSDGKLGTQLACLKFARNAMRRHHERKERQEIPADSIGFIGVFKPGEVIPNGCPLMLGCPYFCVTLPSGVDMVTAQYKSAFTSEDDMFCAIPKEWIVHWCDDVSEFKDSFTEHTEQCEGATKRGSVRRQLIVASGHDLDCLASTYGFRGREYMEDDVHYRKYLLWRLDSWKYQYPKSVEPAEPETIEDMMGHYNVLAERVNAAMEAEAEAAARSAQASEEMRAFGAKMAKVFADKGIRASFYPAPKNTKV